MLGIAEWGKVTKQGHAVAEALGSTWNIGTITGKGQVEEKYRSETYEHQKLNQKGNTGHVDEYTCTELVWYAWKCWEALWRFQKAWGASENNREPQERVSEVVGGPRVTGHNTLCFSESWKELRLMSQMELGWLYMTLERQLGNNKV